MFRLLLSLILLRIVRLYVDDKLYLTCFLAVFALFDNLTHRPIHTVPMHIFGGSYQSSETIKKDET